MTVAFCNKIFAFCNLGPYDNLNKNKINDKPNECILGSKPKQQNNKNFNEIPLTFRHPLMPSTERNDSLY